MTTASQTLALLPGEEFIELYKVLKVQSMTGGGGEAKFVISEGMVTVDGEVETRKRKKVSPGQVVSFNGESVMIVAGE
ncbi:RNA-binding S4 domain-containing protein [Shewanella algidipiscicola]|uniref:S4 RNA-binding domain protein n=1 Tax=Shewanella algidipiscicola TaxID=614070 RepID=A0ABQ4NSU2_9GAMM|nr:RNA-binding S4 domain-containing protein [Shewanella algidipiscicola]GIU02036.1 S4 RNA-binding domain protein [Shewanella algidipiscicola]